MWLVSHMSYVTFLNCKMASKNLNEERGGIKKERNKQINLGGTPKLYWQHHQYYRKDLNKTNPMTPRKVTNEE